MATFDKIAADAAADDGLTCSFCGREPVRGGALVAGDQAFICDTCVATCVDLLGRDDGAQEEDATDSAMEANGAGDDSGAEHVYAAPTLVRFLSDADVARLISLDDLNDAMEAALRMFSAGKMVHPPRTVLPIASAGVFAVMPVYGEEPPLLGAKLVSVCDTNAALALPTVSATVVLLNPETGAPLAILGGRYITEIRTAAVSAVSAQLLARDDASVLAIIGSGVQARSHLAAMELAFELSEVRVWSPTPEHAEMFVHEMQPGTSARLIGAASAEQAVRDADLVVLATSSSEPVVQDSWIKAGAHVISVGAGRPDQCEMDPALVKRGRVFVDSRAAAQAESGDVVKGIRDRLFAPSHIVGELGDLLDERVEGRRSPRDVTIFKAVGLAVEDVVAADLAYRRAVAQNVGQQLEL